MPPKFRKAYQGTRRSLVVAIDFGTTYSGVSFALLEPEDVPQVQSVSKYGGQKDSSTKVPSISYHDQEGNVRAQGAQIANGELTYQAQQEGWLRVEWLKLLFRPADHVIKDTDLPEIPIPQGKTSVQVLGDFLQYLMVATKDYIIGNEFNGEQVWESLQGNIVYILSHPNGWDGSQQSRLREASIHGKLIPDTDSGRARIRFVSEGEASFHWCVVNGAVPETLSAGNDIIVADLGGGTIDVSSFRVTSEHLLGVEETRPAQCRLAGSVFVTRAFRRHIEEKLPDNYAHVVDTLVGEFDRHTKQRFRDPLHNHYIPLGILDAHDPEHGVHSGQLMVSGSIISQLFEPSCQAVTEAVLAQLAPESPGTTVFLVGGFAANPWVFNEVQRRLSSFRVVVKRVESSHTAKAVAEGAVGYYLDHHVSARVARFTYGTFGAPPYDPTNPQHAQRATYIEGGKKYVGGGFSTLVKKGASIEENSVNRKRFEDSQSSLIPRGLVSRFDLICYRGAKSDIAWRDEDPDPRNFRTLCSVESVIPASCFKLKFRKRGGFYWTITYWRVVTFGTTEFTCREEKGKLKRSPAKIVWSES